MSGQSEEFYLGGSCCKIIMIPVPPFFMSPHNQLIVIFRVSDIFLFNIQGRFSAMTDYNPANLWTIILRRNDVVEGDRGDSIRIKIKLKILFSNGIKNSQFYRKPLKGYSILKLSKISTKRMQIFCLFNNFLVLSSRFLFPQSFMTIDNLSAPGPTAQFFVK